MNALIRFYWRHRFLVRSTLLIVVFLAAFTLARAVGSQSTLVPCVLGAENCRIAADWHPVSADPAAIPEDRVYTIQPGMPSAGQLTYLDFVRLEREARAKLENGIAIREALSPYNGNIPFRNYVTKFDTNAGFNEAYLEDNPYGSGHKVGEIVSLAVADLQKARDMYAYLAVFAPESRMRADPDLEYKDDKCKQPENPNPIIVDTGGAPTGEVAAPIIDWCNFDARLRQSVREAANLRMVFGQEFMVDAMGLHFDALSGLVLPGEEAVRKEIAQLTAAKYQYEQAQADLLDGLDRVVGNGCRIADFYTNTRFTH